MAEGASVALYSCVGRHITINLRYGRCMSTPDTIVGGFSTALALARACDLIASVPERHTGNLRAGMHGFPLPVATPEITVSLLWHPRLDADPAHRWLRGHVKDVCAALR
jgi:DNA-binding transcriptional LysR family regulator